MRMRRIKVSGSAAVYHCMTRTVNGELLFKDREKEILRKMIRQVADFCGVEVLTFCIMSNHFHVLLCVPGGAAVSDTELMRRYKVLYPKPTKYQEASVGIMQSQLQAGGDEADVIRRKLLARMGDVSEFMKAVNSVSLSGIIVRISVMARCGLSALSRFWLRGRGIRYKRWLLTSTSTLCVRGLWTTLRIIAFAATPRQSPERLKLRRA